MSINGLSGLKAKNSQLRAVFFDAGEPCLAQVDRMWAKIQVTDPDRPLSAGAGN